MKSTTKPEEDYESTSDAVAFKNIMLNPDKRKDVKISLKIGGGLPSQRYNFDLSLTGNGEIDSIFKSDKSKQYREAKSRINDKELDRLFGTIIKSGILNTFQPRQLFLPDTVVGVLTIVYNDHTHSVYFAADEDQAEVQNKKTSPQIKSVVDQLYSIGNKVLKIRSLKP